LLKEKRIIVFLLLIFIFGGIAGYSNIINSFFISDDFSLLMRVFALGPFGAFFKRWFCFYRPMVSLSLFIDYAVWGLNPTGFHITSITIHSLNSFLVFLVCLCLLDDSKIDRNYSLFVALSSGLLFLFLHSHSEAVTWITDRADLLALFFSLNCFLAYMFYRKKSYFLYLPASLLFYACALFSKESAVTIPLIILCYESYLLKSKRNKTESSTKSLSPFLLYLIIFSFYLLARYLVLGELIGGYGNSVHLNFKPALIFENLFSYTARVFLPPTPNIKPIFMVIMILLILLIVGIKSLRKNLPWSLWFLVSAFYLSLLPVINLGINYAKDTQGERFIYLPSAFLSLFAIILFCYILIDHKVLFAIICGSIIIFSALQLFRINKNWVIAGKISQNIVNSIRDEDKADRLFIITLPDNINGAYIFRNGAWEAIDIFVGRGRFKQIKLMSLCEISDEDNKIEIKSNADGYEVQLLNPKGCFKDLGTRYVDDIKCNSFRLRLGDLTNNDKIIFYSAGKTSTLF